MGRRRFAVVGLIVALVFLGACLPSAVGQVAFDVTLLDEGYESGVREDASTRRFVELYLRVAGGVWIVVEWTAAIFLILGYRRLARWVEATDDA